MKNPLKAGVPLSGRPRLVVFIPCVDHGVCCGPAGEAALGKVTHICLAARRLTAAEYVNLSVSYMNAKSLV